MSRAIVALTAGGLAVIVGCAPVDRREPGDQREDAGQPANADEGDGADQAAGGEDAEGIDLLEEIDPLPPGAAEVERRVEELAQPVDHPLFDVPAGTVMDDLVLLDGCWGAYFDNASPGPLEPDGSAEFYRFDVQAGEMVYEVIQRSPVGLPPFIPAFDIGTHHAYSFEFSGPDGVVGTLQSSWFGDNLPDDDVFPPIPEDLLMELDVPPIQLQITLDGDAFKFGDSLDASPDFSAPHRANLVFFRFDCPE